MYNPRLNIKVDKENHTYETVSKVAYLLGVTDKFFGSEQSPFLHRIFIELEATKEARIIRDLSIIRTAFVKNFSKIAYALHNDLKNINSVPEFIPTDVPKRLTADDVPVLRINCKADKYFFHINELINENIPACRTLFPAWIKWEYIAELFQMPKGSTVQGTKAAAEQFHRYYTLYPYQVYLNWKPHNFGNILLNDAKFLTWLYQSHQDKFTEFELVSDCSNSDQYNIHNFIQENGRIDIVADCENSDPYKLEAMLKSLNQSELSQIEKIILYDDVNTVAAWQFFESVCSIPVERIIVNRIKIQKSLVDMSLVIGVCKEFYENNMQAFILLSSDSDYWSLISAMPNAKFLVALEDERTSDKMLDALDESNIPYCWLDDFCTGYAQELKLKALRAEVGARLSQIVNFNIYNIVDDVSDSLHIHLLDTEREQIFKDYRSNMILDMDKNGNITVRLTDKNHSR